ncbi:MAG: hypothetical protein HC929_24350 [Leptolyngbyaceae cyanobacterium SM2_5_2]|nr:hypothetical protein [Leptolyngbyaceae cyanobacterium SM2_5_2]
MALYPAQPSLETQGAVILDRLINTVDATCRADPDCNASYPDVQGTFEAIVDRLNATPATVELHRLGLRLNFDGSQPRQRTVEITGSDVAQTLFGMAYTEGAPALMPAMIYQINAGDYGLASQALYSNYFPAVQAAGASPREPTSRSPVLRILPMPTSSTRRGSLL